MSPREEYLASPSYNLAKQLDHNANSDEQNVSELELGTDTETKNDIGSKGNTGLKGSNIEVEIVPDQNDTSLELTLRPKRLEDFVGQNELRSHLEIILKAAKQRGQAADHILFAGPPGLGKTTLAGIVAQEMGVGFRITSGPVLARGGDLASILTDLNDGDVLFVDEIHRLQRTVEEVLYPAMEDFQLDVLLGKGAMARSIRLDLPRFTLVGATTRTGLLTGPLRDRFGHVSYLDYYPVDDLTHIVTRAANVLGVEIAHEAAIEIARRSRGTPRIANRLLRRVRDFAEVKGNGVVTQKSADDALKLYGVDSLGLDRMDRQILIALCQRFKGRPVGLSTLCVSVSEEPETIEDVYEPYLLKLGLIERTPRGRIATPLAFDHLKLDLPWTLALEE